MSYEISCGYLHLSVETCDLTVILDGGLTLLAIQLHLLQNVKFTD